MSKICYQVYLGKKRICRYARSLFLLNGCENTNSSPKLFISNMVNTSNPLKHNSLIPIGYGSGLLSHSVFN